MGIRIENRVVARFLDGSVLRGNTIDFSPTRMIFHIDGGNGPMQVELTSLKALFFVKDFDGNPEYSDRPGFHARQNHGKKVVVEFKDGEVIYGYTLSYTTLGTGFFIFSGDPSSNNEKAFVIHAAARSVRFTAVTSSQPRANTAG